MAFKVIDVSRYQGDIDWEQVKADGVEGAMLKTVSTNNREFGGLYIDPYFERNYAECKRLGIPVGVYYYTYAQDKAYADKELALFKKAIEGKTFEYPLVVDVEDNLLKPLSADALTDLVEYAVQTIESWGCYAMVYTYLYYQKTELNMERLAKYDLWIAHYSEKCGYTKAHGMWQYASTGSVKGVKGACDMNWAYKDYPDIIKAAGLNGFGKVENSEDVTALKQKIKELEAELVAEHDAKVYLQKEKEKLAKNYGRVSAELSVANNALAGERKAADVLKADNAKLTDMLNEIKTIVGG